MIFLKISWSQKDVARESALQTASETKMRFWQEIVCEVRG
jgi:hypothetical protein